jgi:hypothetical protein
MAIVAENMKLSQNNYCDNSKIQVAVKQTPDVVSAEPTQEVRQCKAEPTEKQLSEEEVLNSKIEEYEDILKSIKIVRSSLGNDYYEDCEKEIIIEYNEAKIRLSELLNPDSVIEPVAKNNNTSDDNNTEEQFIGFTSTEEKEKLHKTICESEEIGEYQRKVNAKIAKEKAVLEVGNGMQAGE